MSNKTKILLTLIAVVFGYLTFTFLLPNQEANADGFIVFVLVDENGETVVHEEIEYFTGDSIFDILDRNYQVVCADNFYEPDETCSYDSAYGKAILEIQEVKTDWNNNFLALYINDEYATYGVSKLPYKDGDIISFKWTSLS